MNATPEFMQAAEKACALAERLGQDHRDAKAAMVLAMELAPADLKATIAAKAREMGLIPEPCGYLADGTPLYNLGDVAAKLGQTPEEAQQAMAEMMAAREDMGLPCVLVEPGAVHRRQ